MSGNSTRRDSPSTLLPMGREEKKRAVLLTVVGPQAYALLSNLVAPTKPAEKTYTALTNAMLDQLKPKPLIIVRFHRRNQTEGEGISQK